MLDPVQDDIALPEAPVSVTQTGQDNQASVAPVTPTVVKNSAPVKVAAEQPVPVTVTEVPETNEYQDSAWIIQLVALKMPIMHAISWLTYKSVVTKRMSNKRMISPE